MERDIKIRVVDGVDYPVSCDRCGAFPELTHYRIISPSGGIIEALCVQCLNALYGGEPYED